MSFCCRCSASFRIEEQLYNKSTAGGAAYKVILESNSTYNSCVYTDHFNGTYTICCPILAQLTNVTVYLMHVGFSAYVGGRGFYEPICSTKIVHPNYINPTFESITEFSSTDVPRIFNDRSGHAHWRILNEEWKLIESNELFLNVSSTNISQCLVEKYKESVHLIGDSHIRYLFFYFMEVIGKLQTFRSYKFPHGEHYNHYKYSWTTHIETVIMQIKTLNRTIHMNNSPGFLVLTGGSWDLPIRDVHKVFNDFSKALDSLREVMTSLHQRNIHAPVIWHTAPVWPHNKLFYKDTSYRRNNFNNGALNAWLCPRLEKIGITCIDTWRISRAWEDRMVCGDHILCASKDGVHGHVGHAMVQQLMYRLCS